jgi:hypothetical protein
MMTVDKSFPSSQLTSRRGTRGLSSAHFLSVEGITRESHGFSRGEYH